MFEELEKEFLMRKRAHRKELAVIVGCGAVALGLLALGVLIVWRWVS